jgi:hypothetical protein
MNVYGQLVSDAVGLPPTYYVGVDRLIPRWGQLAATDQIFLEGGALEKLLPISFNPSLASKAKEISLGEANLCVLFEGGGITCFGRGEFGVNGLDHQVLLIILYQTYNIKEKDGLET